MAETQRRENPEKPPKIIVSREGAKKKTIDPVSFKSLMKRWDGEKLVPRPLDRIPFDGKRVTPPPLDEIKPERQEE